MRCRASAEPQAQSAPAAGAGRMSYRPDSYAEICRDAAQAMSAGIKDGLKRLEVEFPPVPVNIDCKLYVACLLDVLQGFSMLLGSKRRRSQRRLWP